MSKLTHVLVAEKLNGTQSWYWIPELDKYQQFSEGCREGEDDQPYEPYYMTPEEYEARMENSIFENIAFYDGREKYLAKQEVK
ncbi:hypothetical protein [Microcoleus vaginatus]|uniref:hypothetical protein n=1 Tax=Microcoleus vaginatus TaxID=119532 RepID=UPI001F60FB40|nr:hypothetical protein D0A37_02685 [Microcoleus vaginatus HSN003]